MATKSRGTKTAKPAAVTEDTEISIDEQVAVKPLPPLELQDVNAEPPLTNAPEATVPKEETADLDSLSNMPQAKASKPPQPRQVAAKPAEPSTMKLKGDDLARKIVEKSPETQAHECGLPVEMIGGREGHKNMAKYVNDNLHQLGTSMQKLDTSCPAIRERYPRYKEYGRGQGYFPRPPHMFAAALVLWSKGITLEAPEVEDANKLLAQLR